MPPPLNCEKISHMAKMQKFHMQMCVKITKIVATRYQFLTLKCTKFDFGWGSAPDAAKGGYSSPLDPDPLDGFEGSILLSVGKETK